MYQSTYFDCSAHSVFDKRSSGWSTLQKCLSTAHFTVLDLPMTGWLVTWAWQVQCRIRQSSWSWKTSRGLLSSRRQSFALWVDSFCFPLNCSQGRFQFRNHLWPHAWREKNNRCKRHIFVILLYAQCSHEVIVDAGCSRQNVKPVDQGVHARVDNLVVICVWISQGNHEWHVPRAKGLTIRGGSVAWLFGQPFCVVVLQTLQNLLSWCNPYLTCEFPYQYFCCLSRFRLRQSIWPFCQ